MHISGVLAAAKFLSSALGHLTTWSESTSAVQGTPPEKPSVSPGQAAPNPAALREILARYDVTEISPRDFSTMIQKLYEAGALTDQQFQELSLIRIDLDQEGLDPDEPLDLLDFYLDKVRQLHRDLEDLQDPLDPGSVIRPPVAAVQRRLEWVEKFALIQSSPDAAGVDALA